jgi:trans-2,3-dihydro-3-hydroxyanthranilate isomerase
VSVRRYVTADVFTDRVFGGNPLAVVLEASGLSATQMQSIAAEFNYAETTFVLPPREPANTARVRIFTPRSEVPFAGHPNIGTAVVLAQEWQARGRPLPREFLFEEGAGLVSVGLQLEGGRVVGAELKAPESLSRRVVVPSSDAASCLSLSVADIRTELHEPQVISVGLPFLVTELASRTALTRARPSLADHERVLPPAGTDAIFAYVRGDSREHLRARMFAPIDGIIEDPATGSATVATIALLASLDRAADGVAHWRIEQGVEMGRPSALRGRTEKQGGQIVAAYVAGAATLVMQGELNVPDEPPA